MMDREEFLKQISEESELVRVLVTVFALCAVVGISLFYGGYWFGFIMFALGILVLLILEIGGWRKWKNKIKGELKMENPNYEHDMRVWENSTADNRSNIGIVSAAGQNALKSMLIINGGASVAMLAFISNIYKYIHKPSLLDAVSKSMMIFVWGTLLGAVAFGIVFLSEYLGSITDKGKLRTFALFLNYCSWFIVFLGYSFFLWGAYTASGAFEIVAP